MKLWVLDKSQSCQYELMIINICTSRYRFIDMFVCMGVCLYTWVSSHIFFVLYAECFLKVTSQWQ